MGADEAFVVAQPSTPASYFHLLRKHSLGEEHRPLIVFTPKSMLKRKEAASQPADFTEGTFRPVIGDDTVDPDSVEKVLLCCGRITWDLMVERKKREGDSPRTAIVRVEQLYPRPVAELKAELAKYPNLKEVRWVQDEPANMGPWPHMALQPHPGAGRDPVLPGVAAGVVVAVGGPALAARRGAEGAHPAGLQLTGCVLHRPRDRGAREAPGRRGGHPRLGRRPASRSSSTPSPSSRCRSSGWPPGWPASTTPTTSSTRGPVGPAHRAPGDRR